ncbi:MAG: hypothetical protein ACK4NY_00870 [Spirosomataceae bacterium]
MNRRLRRFTNAENLRGIFSEFSGKVQRTSAGKKFEPQTTQIYKRRKPQRNFQRI